MYIYDEKNDVSNVRSHKFIQINGCGFQNMSSDFLVVRENGRRDYHILLINKGLCIAEHKGTQYTLSPGNLIIYEPTEKQKYMFKPNSESLWCHFSGNAIQEIFESAKIKSGVYFIKPNIAIFEYYSSLIQRFHQPGRKKYSTASFLELIYNISDATTHSDNAKNLDIILPVLKYINANYNKDITLDTLANLTGYSKSRFSHIFSEATGTTPNKYQNDIRLNVSREMLSSTELSIREIAVSCGFRDPLYFSRVFKKKYNIAPTEYRK